MSAGRARLSKDAMALRRDSPGMSAFIGVFSRNVELQTVAHFLRQRSDRKVIGDFKGEEVKSRLEASIYTGGLPGTRLEVALSYGHEVQMRGEVKTGVVPRELITRIDLDPLGSAESFGLQFDAAIKKGGLEWEDFDMLTRQHGSSLRFHMLDAVYLSKPFWNEEMLPISSQFALGMTVNDAQLAEQTVKLCMELSMALRKAA